MQEICDIIMNVPKLLWFEVDPQTVECFIQGPTYYLHRLLAGIFDQTSKWRQNFGKRKNISTSIFRCRNRCRNFDVESRSIFRRRNILTFFNAFSTSFRRRIENARWVVYHSAAKSEKKTSQLAAGQCCYEVVRSRPPSSEKTQ